MKKILNTLYITEEDVYISSSNNNIILLKENESIGKFPIHILENIICFSYSGASPAAIQVCGENNVSINFITPQGKYIGAFIGSQYGNITTRKKQYRISESEDALDISKIIIKAKIINQKNVILKLIRESGKKELSYLKSDLDEQIKDIDKCEAFDSLLGIEGYASKIYFSRFNEFIKSQKEDFIFTDRNKRPPRDMVNALLSLMYTILTNEYTAAIQSVGLDSYAGFYHKDRSGRHSLACDLVEELRASLVDRFVLNLINNRIITKKDFRFDDFSIPSLEKDSFKKVLSAWQKRKKDTINHPFFNESIQIGLIPYTQALILSRLIRGDIGEYIPFIWR